MKLCDTIQKDAAAEAVGAEKPRQRGRITCPAVVSDYDESKGSNTKKLLLLLCPQ